MSYDMKDGKIVYNGQVIANVNEGTLSFDMPAKPKIKLTKRMKKALKAEREKYKIRRSGR